MISVYGGITVRATREGAKTVVSTLETPVLIAGGGPTGLVLASVLAREGVSCVLAERNPSTTRFPKMDITNGASMELLRRLGVDEHLRQVGVAPRHSFDVIFAPGLNGPEISRWHLPSVDEQRSTLRDRRTVARCTKTGWYWSVPICTSPGADTLSPMRRSSSGAPAAPREGTDRRRQHSQEDSP
jgi:FAD binding domain